MTEQNVTPSKEYLKVQALTQRIAELVAQYEERSADMRAEATMIIEGLTKRVQELEAEKDAPTEEAPTEEQG